MGSGHSKSAEITSNGNEGLKGLIEEEEGSNGVAKVFSQAGRSTRETTNLGTEESSQATKPTRSDHGEKFDVFLSHSGKQKNFVRQLFQDLTNQGVSCFFDEDYESLPVGEYFPSLIFEAVEECRLAVLLLSKDFLETKWPMLELSAFVKARDINPNLEILPLFFMIPPEALKQITADNEKWIELEISKESRAEWHQALNEIPGFNGLTFSEGGDEVDFRHDIVKEIWLRLPTLAQRYPVPCMQGEERMCQEVADFFKNVRPNEKEIRIVGLHGKAGQGKTTLGKAFCNLKWGYFEGKVCHLEFTRGDSFERIKHALQYLTQCRQSYLQTLTEDQARVELYKRLKGQKVLLVLDNITEENKDEVIEYVLAVMGKTSWILLSARSVDFLVQHFKIDPQSCMEVPRFEDDEGIRILLERTSLKESTLGAKDRNFACDIVCRARTLHRLALKALGVHLFSNHGSNLSEWVAEINGWAEGSGCGLDDVFAVLGKAFDDMHCKHRTIFMLLTVYMLPDTSPHKVIEWLSITCNEDISYIKKVVEDLCKNGFIEGYTEGKFRIHDIYMGFAQSKAKEMGRWLWWKGDPRSTRGLMSKDNEGFEFAKLEKCMYRSPSQIAPRYLENLLVLQLVGVQNMSKLQLGRMENLISITLHDCKDLAVLDGMENLPCLAWLQIRGVNSMLKLPELSSLTGLQHIEINISDNQVTIQLGDLTLCFNLREINVSCPSLLEFPSLKNLVNLEKVEFHRCDKVKDPLDCTGCVKLQSIVLDRCCGVAASPVLVGCEKLPKIICIPELFE